jgi:hypothetical protein
VRSKALADQANFLLCGCGYAADTVFEKLQRGRGVESVVSTELVPDGVFVWRRLDDL